MASGLHISRVRTPLGVIGVIYESRPNVTADAGALCLKAGNAVILRGGSESFNSSGKIHECLVEGLRSAGLPEAAIQRVPTRDRAAVQEMLTLVETIYVIVPRGGKGLVFGSMRTDLPPGRIADHGLHTKWPGPRAVIHNVRLHEHIGRCLRDVIILDEDPATGRFIRENRI